MQFHTKNVMVEKFLSLSYSHFFFQKCHLLYSKSSVKIAHLERALLLSKLAKNGHSFFSEVKIVRKSYSLTM